MSEPSSASPASTASAPGAVVIDGRYIADHYPGIGRYVFNLVGALATAAPEQAFSLLIDPDAPQSRFDLGDLESEGVELVRARGRRWPRGQVGLRRACRHLSPAVFHAPHILLGGRLSCPSVVTIHDLTPMHEPSALSSRRNRLLYRVLLRRSLASATGVITPSRAVRDDLRQLKGVSPDLVSLIPEAADPSFRPAPPEQLAALRARLGLPDAYVLCVGTNRPHKNLPRLVDAWAGLADAQRDGGLLVIAGPEDPRYPEARRRAKAVGRDTVRFLGMVPEADLPALYGGARLVVQPSLREGFGLPIIEAMACGAPVACSQAPALDETSDGAALPFDPTSVRDIRSAICRVLSDEDLRRRLVARGLTRAGALSWTRTASLTLAAYRRAIARHETREIRS